MTSNEDLLKLTKVKLLEKCEELGIKKCRILMVENYFLKVLNKFISNIIRYNIFF